MRLDRGVLKPEIGSTDTRPPRKDRKGQTGVSDAPLRQGGPKFGGVAESLSGNSPVPSKSLFVHNLSWSITDDALFEYFGTAGNPISAEVKRSGKDGRSRGWAVVTYGSVDEASIAMLKLHASTLDERKISIRYDAKAEN